MSKNFRIGLTELRDVVVGALADGRWHVAAEIEQKTGVRPVEVREVANAYGDEIIGLTNGYKLVSAASRDEILHAYNSLHSRAREIRKRANKLIKVLG